MSTSSLSGNQGDFSIERYMRWLDIADGAPTGADTGKVAALLRNAGVPVADADAIAKGILNLRAATAQADRSRQFMQTAQLAQYGGGFQSELVRGGEGQNALRKTLLIGAAGLVSAVVVLGTYTLYRHHVGSVGSDTSHSPPPQADAKPKQKPATESKRAPKSHAHATTDNADAVRQKADVKQAGVAHRPSAHSSAGSVAPVGEGVSPSALDPSTFQPGTCPPGVLRLGCPSGGDDGTGGTHR